MAVVVEVVSRSGEVINCQVFDQETVTIGRAYNNDVILPDNYVDACHMYIQSQGNGNFLCIDNNSANGIFDHKKIKKTKESVLINGSLISIGKTILKILSTHAEVEPALLLSIWEGVGDFLSRWWIMLLLSALLSVLSIIDVNINYPLIVDKSKKYIDTIYLLVGVSIYSGLFALIGKFCRHDSRFLIYFNVLLCTLIITFLSDWLIKLFVFNFAIQHSMDLINTVFYALVLGGLINLSFLFAAHFHPLRRFLLSAILPVVMMIHLSLGHFKTEKFSPLPHYDAIAFHEAWYWGATETQAGFVNSVEAMYTASDKLSSEVKSP